MTLFIIHCSWEYHPPFIHLIHSSHSLLITDSSHRITYWVIHHHSSHDHHWLSTSGSNIINININHQHQHQQRTGHHQRSINSSPRPSTPNEHHHTINTTTPTTPTTTTNGTPTNDHPFIHQHPLINTNDQSLSTPIINNIIISFIAWRWTMTIRSSPDLDDQHWTERFNTNDQHHQHHTSSTSSTPSHHQHQHHIIIINTIDHHQLTSIIIIIITIININHHQSSLFNIDSLTLSSFSTHSFYDHSLTILIYHWLLIIIFNIINIHYSIHHSTMTHDDVDSLTHWQPSNEHGSINIIHHQHPSTSTPTPSSSIN